MFDFSPDNQLYLPQSVVDKIPRLEPDDVQYIIVHCSDTSASNSLTIKDIDGWHKSRGFECIGYHYVVRPDGFIMVGRPDVLQGAHAVMYNKKSIGICYIGGRLNSGAPGDTRTFAQKISLAYLFGLMLHKYPFISEIIGHNDVSAKMCPCFDAKAEYANFVSKFRSSFN